MTEHIEQRQAVSILEKKITNLDYHVTDFLGFYHENCMDTINLLYLEEKGCEFYGQSLEDIQKAGPEFLQNIVHPTDLMHCVDLLVKFATEEDETKILCYNQRLKLLGTEEYQTYFTCAKINLEKRIFQCVTTPMTNIKEFSSEVTSILDTSQYIDLHTKLYTQFSKREREVIKWVCKGYTVNQIGEILFLSPHTIEKHKKNIYKKSNFTSKSQLVEFSINFSII